MLRNLALSCALITAVLVATAPASAGTMAPDPQQIAAACIAANANRADHCVQQNAVRANVCVAHIEALLANGHGLAARHVAESCVETTRRNSRLCVAEIRLRGALCQVRLLSLGAPGLAVLVNDATTFQAHRVQLSRAAAVNAIQDALPGGG